MISEKLRDEAVRLVEQISITLHGELDGTEQGADDFAACDRLLAIVRELASAFEVRLPVQAAPRTGYLHRHNLAEGARGYIGRIRRYHNCVPLPPRDLEMLAGACYELDHLVTEMSLQDPHHPARARKEEGNNGVPKPSASPGQSA